MKFTVYCHTNCRNGKRYVGWCNTTIETRWEEHCKSARGGSMCLFHKAIRKYGEDVWEHEVIERLNTLKMAKRAEICWIAQRRTFAYDEGNLGYNETRGGDGILGYRHTEETKQRLRELNTGSNHPTWGKPSAIRGRKQKPEHVAKRAKALRGKKRDPEIGRKQSERQRGTKFPAERCKNISLGKKRAIELRRKRANDTTG